MSGLSAIFVCMLNFERKTSCHGLLNFNMEDGVFLTNFEVSGNAIKHCIKCLIQHVCLLNQN